MRKRFNRSAVCNSENYSASLHAHLKQLQENHTSFCNMVVSGEITFDIPIVKEGSLQPKFKTVRIFGKDIKVTIEEYNIHFAHLNF